ncbi:MAG TPA: hypothetical protein VFB31_15130 [Pseudolabrys sp.]|nr:hypothetical protein [Pseudolabrys sp.]
MKRKITLAGVVLAVSTVVFGSTAHAGAMISDKRYWPNEAGSSRASATTRVEQSLQNPAAPRGAKKQRRREKALKMRRNPS